MLNVSKTQILLIGTTRGLRLAADNNILERVDTFKYLGVTMDETLSWKEVVSLLGKKIPSRLALLRPALGKS